MTAAANLTKANGGLLREAINEQAAAKVGLFGSQGTGKSTTAALLAIGLSKTFHAGGPVAMHDTENGSDFLKPMFEAEGIKLYVRKSRAFADMAAVLHEAEKIGCCAFIEDSITHTWNELKESFRSKKKVTRLEFQHWDAIKTQWRTDWVDPYLNSPLHCLIAGRAGYEYEYQATEETKADGSPKMELIKGASKMKAEGEFGYEPSLLIEMEAVRENLNPRHRGGEFIHYAYVLKDRARSLQGRRFQYPNINGYKPSDWKKVFKDFLPHFQFLNIGGTQKALDAASSERLFGADGNSEYYAKAQRKKVVLETIENTMVMLWPGQDQASKRLKLKVLETLFNVRAWSAVEQMPIERLEREMFRLEAFKRQFEAEPPETEIGILNLLANAQPLASPAEPQTDEDVPL